jgi:hypothetical protein
MVAVILTAPADPPLLVQVALRGVGFRPGHDGKSVRSAPESNRLMAVLQTAAFPLRQRTRPGVLHDRVGVAQQKRARSN